VTPLGPPPDLLRLASDRTGWTPEDWLAAALAGAEGPVVEIRCAREHPATHLTLRRMVFDRCAVPDGLGDRTPVALGRADMLPLRTNAAAGVGAVMCLPIAEPLNSLFAELRRVLRPAATLAALVPSHPRVLETPGWRRRARVAQHTLNRALAGRPGFRHDAARDRLGWLFASADFAVLADQRRVFWVAVPDADSATHVVSGLAAARVWPPDVSRERLRRGAAALAKVAAPGVRLPVALRLVLGRR
jgi:SAM-dependent methyltransferase